MSKTKFLVVDDDPAIRFAVGDFLEAHGYHVSTAEDCITAEQTCLSVQPEMAIIDYRLPDGTALDLLQRLKEIDPELSIVILTGHGSINIAVRAIQEGAEHFLTKPVELPALLAIVQRVLENKRNRRKQLAGKARNRREVVNPFLGIGMRIRELEEQVNRILYADTPVLIHGETGTGKSLLATWMHHNGPRSDEAFVDLSCAGLSREFLETELFGHKKGAFTGAVTEKTGLLEVAHRGTVFLDEIGDMESTVQPKLLKVLEEKCFRRLGDIRDRHVDIRLIAASHKDLRQLVKDGHFRSDLYFRISAIPLILIPLRERIEDIPLLARFLLDQIAGDLAITDDISLSPDALRALQNYSWPGNIRELRNVLERAVLMSGKRLLERNDLLFATADDNGTVEDSLYLTLQQVEERHIERVLRDEKGHVERTAKRLGIPRSTLYQRIKKYQFDISGF